jgi:hypothetical protein
MLKKSLAMVVAMMAAQASQAGLYHGRPDTGGSITNRASARKYLHSDKTRSARREDNLRNQHNPSGTKLARKAAKGTIGIWV